MAGALKDHFGTDIPVRIAEAISVNGAVVPLGSFDLTEALGSAKIRG